MELKTKSNENIDLVEYAILAKKYCTSVAGRVYYAVFQAIKHFLEQEGFDYQRFLTKIHEPDQKEYSHGTLKRALCDHLMTKKLNLGDAGKIGTIDQLYRMRIEADYRKREYNEADLSSYLRSARQIIGVIDKY